VTATIPNMMRASLLALLTTWSVLWLAADSYAENLLQVYHQTAAASPVLARAQALLDADLAARPMARAELLPKIDIVAGISQNRADIVGLGPSQGIQSYSGNHYSVSLSQPLFNGPAYAAQDAAENRIRAGEAGLLATGQRLILQVTEAYFAVLKAQADLHVAVNQRTLLSKILDRAETSREIGTGDVIDVHEARARADAAESELVLAKNSLRLARQHLQRLTHQPFGTLDGLAAVKAEGPLPDRLEFWVQSAFDQHPRLRQARQELQAAEAQVSIASRARWPRMALDAGYSHVKGELLPEMERDELTASVNVRLPLYQGGEIGAKTSLARSLAEASRFRLEDLRDQVRLETETAFFNLQNSVAGLNAASQALTSAQTSLQATREGNRVGVRSLIDLLTVIQEFTAIERKYYTALYDHVAARIRLKAAAGVLTVEDLAAINSLLSPDNANSDKPERND